MSNKQYRLLKDLPDSKAGDVYVLCDEDKAWPPVYYKNGDQNESYWLQTHVENSPEWFEEIKEPQETKSIDSFQWTDELVQEYVGTSLGETIQDMAYFKASKTNSTKEGRDALEQNRKMVNAIPQPKEVSKDWEIVAADGVRFYHQKAVDKLREDAFNAARQETEYLNPSNVLGRRWVDKTFETFSDFKNNKTNG